VHFVELTLHNCITTHGTKKHNYAFDVRKSLHHHTIQINCQQDATVSQVYYLTFMCGSACFGRFLAHHQEFTTALAASGFTVGAWW